MRIRRAGGFVVGQRVQGVLALTRSFGDFTFKQNPGLPPESQIITALPDVREFKVDNNRLDFVVLGSDGIWDVMSNQQVVDLVWSLIRKRKSAIRLRRLANFDLKRDLRNREMKGFGSL